MIRAKVVGKKLVKDGPFGTMRYTVKQMKVGLERTGVFVTHTNSSDRTFLGQNRYYIYILGNGSQVNPRKATASSPGAVRVRRLAQGHLNTQLGGAGDRTSDLLVTSQRALPPEPQAAQG